MFFSADAKEAKPNILIILLDDAGYADFGFMGCEDLETPNIDRLADRGIVFTDAHVTATVCSPSRAGLLTGRYQQRFGHECNIPPEDSGMDPAEITIADVLKTAGYQTYMIGKWHVGNRSSYHPNTRGFDEFYGFLEGGRDYFPNAELDRPASYKAILRNRQQIDFEGYLTDVFTDQAIRYIEANGESPFFMFLSYNAVHTPMHAKQEDLDRYQGHTRQKLAAMTWNVDQNIGRVLDKLEELQLSENTLIFFLSDNGGAESNQSSNEPLKGWKGNKYEGGHRVPFIVSWPLQIDGGLRYYKLTSALDIFATSIVAAGLEKTPGNPLDGVDLIPFLSGESTKAPHDKLFWRKDRMAAMRHGYFKLVRLEGFGYRLYSLKDNAGEDVDLSESHSGQLASMIKDLKEWEAELASPLWYEDENWNEVTYEIHQALMENREPHYITPNQMRAYKAEIK
ncbi:MAG: sulfatase-like hydrolase/transferase [Opitutales bacterium]|nr:sulfatase-like hydrolase/transferase [Opitutales bacterium]